MRADPRVEDFIGDWRIAYFSMEVALRSEIPTYSGGLGVLAGDVVRSAADLGLPLVTVTLVSRAGYFRQELDAEGRQRELEDPWDPGQWAVPLDAKIGVPVEGRTVWVGGWLYVLVGHTGGRQPVVLLDTDLPENHPDDRRLTHHLYGGDESYRIKQEIVLGIGGVRMLRAVDFHIREYHLNEGHSAFLTLELLRTLARPEENLRPGEPRYDFPAVRALCNFTTHTPVEAGHDQFSYELVTRILGEAVDLATLKMLAGKERLNMTRLALSLSEYVNGVAKSHAEVSQLMFPGYVVRAITNGVHPFTWTAPPWRALYDRHIPGWGYEPELLRRVTCCVDDDEIWAAHERSRQDLIACIAERTGVAFDPARPIIGLARRMTAYKRIALLFEDEAELLAIAREWPFQIVIAGKAHPRDEAGKATIAALHRTMRQLGDRLPMAFLPDYDMDLALSLVSGSDLWLNTPLRPLEASGTSGMKAAFNGVPSLSVLDGWWVEGCIEGVTGWAIGDAGSSADGDAASLYQKLRERVLPLYHQDRAGWIAVMRGAIGQNAAFFHSHRMMRRYAAEAYIV